MSRAAGLDAQLVTIAELSAILSSVAASCFPVSCAMPWYRDKKSASTLAVPGTCRQMGYRSLVKVLQLANDLSFNPRIILSVSGL